MDFIVNGTRTTIKITKVVEKIEDGEVTLGKQTVREATGCPSSEDGDSSAWYDYAAEALDQGAQHKLQGNQDKLGQRLGRRLLLMHEDISILRRANRLQ